MPIIQFKIPTVVVGAAPTFPGALPLLRSRGIDVIVLNEHRRVDLMREFQLSNPELWAEDIGEYPQGVASNAVVSIRIPHPVFQIGFSLTVTTITHNLVQQRCVQCNHKQTGGLP